MGLKKGKKAWRGLDDSQVHCWESALWWCSSCGRRAGRVELEARMLACMHADTQARTDTSRVRLHA